MRKLARSLALAALFAGPVIGLSAKPAHAAAQASSGPAAVERYDFDQSWCFDDGWKIYCTVMDATLFVTIPPDGRELATIHVRQDVAITDHSGASLGGYRTVSLDRFVFGNGGQDKTFSVTHTRATSDTETCVSTAVFKIVAFELQMDKLNGPLCR